MKGQRRAERELTLSASSMHLAHAAHHNNARDSQAGVVAQIAGSCVIAQVAMSTLDVGDAGMRFTCIYLGDFKCVLAT